MASFVVFALLDDWSRIHLKDSEILSTAIDRVIAEPLLWYKLHHSKWWNGLKRTKKILTIYLSHCPFDCLSEPSRRKEPRVKKLSIDQINSFYRSLKQKKRSGTIKFRTQKTRQDNSWPRDGKAIWSRKYNRASELSFYYKCKWWGFVESNSLLKGCLVNEGTGSHLLCLF